MPDKNEIKVLHSVDVYLRTTENWILPQITQVSGVDGAVFFRLRVNSSESSSSGRQCFQQAFTGPGSTAFLARAYRSAARRLQLAKAIDWARLFAWRPSVINAHFGPRGFDSLWLKKMLGVPLITTFYGFDAWMLPSTKCEWQNRYAKLFRYGDLFLVEGPALGARLESIGCPPEKIRIRTLGVDLGLLPFKARTNTDCLKIAMVGRFVEKKGLVDGMLACAAAAASGVNLSVVVIGDSYGAGDPAGEKIKAELQAVSERTEMAGRVQFTGLLPHAETQSRLAECDVLLCPSKHAANGDAEGGLPVVLTEAMAMGLFCIASWHCDIPEAVIHEATGFLHEQGDIGQLAELIRRASHDYRKIGELTAAARKHVETKYSLSRQLEALGEIYRDCHRAQRDYQN